VKLTLDDLRDYIRKMKDEYKKVETKLDHDQFISNFIAKIEITSEVITLYLSYDRITKHLAATYLKVAEIDRDELMVKSKVSKR
jgi:hypothetical protein